MITSRDNKGLESMTTRDNGGLESMITSRDNEGLEADDEKWQSSFWRRMQITFLRFAAHWFSQLRSATIKGWPWRCYWWYIYICKCWWWNKHSSFFMWCLSNSNCCFNWSENTVSASVTVLISDSMMDSWWVSTRRFHIKRLQIGNSIFGNYLPGLIFLDGQYHLFYRNNSTSNI